MKYGVVAFPSKKLQDLANAIEKDMTHIMH